MRYEIHDYPKMLARAEQSICSEMLSQRNRTLIGDFEKHLVVKGISVPRIVRYLGVLLRTAKKLQKDLDQVTKEDMTEIICALEKSQYTEATKLTDKAILKRFFKWLKGNDTFYPPEVSWITNNKSRSKLALPKTEDMLTEEDIIKIIDVCRNPRDKAFVAVLWESGGRISEVGALTVGGLKFDQYGVTLTLNGKTGPRTVRLIGAVPFLATWLNAHPRKHDRTAPLWVTIGTHGTGRLLMYRYIPQMLKRLFRWAGVQKRCNPHTFRHSRATFLANHLTEFQMNQYFGWVQGSNMPSTYVHLSGKNTDQALLELYGIKVPETRQTLHKPLKCSRCDTVNPFTAQLCTKCGAVLDVKAAAVIDKHAEQRDKADLIMNDLMKDPDVRELLLRKVRELSEKAA